MPVKTAPATFEAPAKTALRTMLSAAWWFTAVTLRERKLARARAQLPAAHAGEGGAAVRAAPQAVVAGSAVDVDAALSDHVGRLREPVHEADPGRRARPVAEQAVPPGHVSRALGAAAPGPLDVPPRVGVSDHVLADDVPVRGVAAAVAGEDDTALVGVDHVALDERPVRVRVEVHRPAARVVDEQVVADDRAAAVRHVDEVRELARASAVADAVELDHGVGDRAIRADQHAAGVARRR